MKCKCGCDYFVSKSRGYEYGYTVESDWYCSNCGLKVATDSCGLTSFTDHVAEE